jgi:NAD(P)H-flavin reductase
VTGRAAAAPAAELLAPAPFGRRRVAVRAARDLGAYRIFGVEDPEGPRPRAGQFYMLAAVARWGGGDDERPYLPRAFSVLRAPNGTLEFVLEDVGPGTRRLAELEAGDEVWLTGPLGKGFTPPPPGDRAVLVAGGVGIAPLAIWQDELVSAGREVAALVGFRDGAHAAGAELLAHARVATEDGSVGARGRVTELLADELPTIGAGVVYACGPPPMLEAVRAACETHAVAAQLALESPMACGFGACFGCVVPTREGYVRVCVDGPVLDATLLESALLPGWERHR